MAEDGLSMRRRRLATLVVGAIIIALILLLIPSRTVSYNKAEAAKEQDLPVYDHPIEPDVSRETVIDSMPVYDAETEHILHAIALCESTDRHYDENGEVLMNRNGSSATGRYQIMASVWRPVAEAMGIDIDTPAGNKQMAYYILTEAQGITAWSESADCLARHGVFIN